MIPFIDLLSVVSGGLTIAGINLAILRKSLKNPNVKALEDYLDFIKNKKVLVAPCDEEQQGAVVSSLEQIKAKTEEFSKDCNDVYVKELLDRLLVELSSTLRAFHTDDLHKNAKLYVDSYRKLLHLRIELAKTVALICSAFNVAPKSAQMQQFILTFAPKPKS